MTHSLTLRDDGGPVVVTYQAMKDYHGKDFHGGVALAFKALQLALEIMTPPGEIPHRDDIRVILGFNPPGVVDALEYATRAFTRHRAMVDPKIGLGPESIFGSYYFEIHYRNACCRMTLKHGLLPADFTGLARKALAKTASDAERDTWTAYKLALGETIIAMEPRAVLDVLQPA
ncbi:MAG: hypothetical protein AB7E47_14880 [Desulfovibrionaceae bacterium]